MKITISILLVVLSICSSKAQFGEAITKRYYKVEDKDKIRTLIQENIKDNKIDLSLYQKRDTIARKPEFINKNGIKQLRFPVDTGRNFEIEIELTLDGETKALEIYFANRSVEVDTSHIPEDDVLVRFDMWYDGIYNVLQRLHATELVGVADLKKIRADYAPDERKITIRKVNEELEFYVNTNLILVILPPSLVNEIGFKISENTLTLDKLAINYLVNINH